MAPLIMQVVVKTLTGQTITVACFFLVLADSYPLDRQGLPCLASRQGKYHVLEGLQSRLACGLTRHRTNKGICLSVLQPSPTETAKESEGGPCAVFMDIMRLTPSPALVELFSLLVNEATAEGATDFFDCLLTQQQPLPPRLVTHGGVPPVESQSDRLKGPCGMLHFTRDTVVNELMDHEFREHVGAPRSNMQLSAGYDIQPMNSKPLYQDSSRDSSPQTTTQLPAEDDIQPMIPKPSNRNTSRDSSPKSIMQLPAVNDLKRSYRDDSRDSSPRQRRPQAKRMQNTSCSIGLSRKDRPQRCSICKGFGHKSRTCKLASATPRHTPTSSP